jgi:hypothetical protein
MECMHICTYIGKHEGKNHLEDLDVDVKIILEWILGKQGEKVRTGYIRLRIGRSGRIF